MSQRTAVQVEIPGLRIECEGGEALCREVLREVLAPLAGGAWRAAGAPLAVEPAGREATAAPGPSPALPPRPAEPSPVRSPSPAPSPSSPDFSPLFARLASDGGRRSEKDAVLLALVALGSGGKRDATPAEIVAHLESRGYAAGDLKPRPILAKLSHRKGLVAPGLLPNTFRATPAGLAYIGKRAASP